MADITFDDLLEIRSGGDGLTMGGGPSHIATIEAVEAWETKADALRLIFRQTLGRGPSEVCPLDVEVVSETGQGDHVKRSIAYNVGPDERIVADVLIPEGLNGRAPAVLCIHPTTPFGREQVIGNDRTEKGQDRAYALHLVRRGFITLAYDLLSANERKYEGLRDFDTAPFYEKFPEWSVRGKDLWDLSRAIDLLETIPEADAQRVGSIGHSQGGASRSTRWHSSRASRPASRVAATGPRGSPKTPSITRGHAGGWGAPFSGRTVRPASPSRSNSTKPLPCAIMHITALNDFQYSLEETRLARPVLERMGDAVSSVFSLYGAAANYRQVLHEEGHGFAHAQRELAYGFLEKQLSAVSR